VPNIVRLLKALKNPFYSFGYTAGYMAPGFFRRNYQRAARNLGFKKSYLVLSFDCDTEKDIEVIEDVHNRVTSLGAHPIYAVPGELLLLGADVYRRMKKAGAEFINHGYLSHTSYDPTSRNYVSTLFYDRISGQEVIEDIHCGHEAYLNVFGSEPTGFRTPHFGTYNKKNQLSHLYSILGTLGYSFSSSTTPVLSMWKGPVIFDRSGIIEFPVTGCFDYPGRILDSWSFRFSPSRSYDEHDYAHQFRRLVDYFSADENVGIMNIYADPSQVYDWPEFFDCVAYASNNLQTTTFSDILKENHFE